MILIYITMIIFNFEILHSFIKLNILNFKGRRIAFGLSLAILICGLVNFGTSIAKFNCVFLGLHIRSSKNHINKIPKILQFHYVKRLGTGAVVLHVNRLYNIERLIIEVINHFVIFSVDQLLADRRCASEHAFEIRSSQLQ